MSGVELCVHIEKDLAGKPEACGMPRSHIIHSRSIGGGLWFRHEFVAPEKGKKP